MSRACHNCAEFVMPAIDLSRFQDLALWDLLEDVGFWIKDREDRFAWANTALLARMRAARDEVLGTRDSDWFFNELASVYMADDEAILAGGPAIINKHELVMNEHGSVVWHVTSKYPLKGCDGSIIGTYGMSRAVESPASIPAEYADLSTIVSYARNMDGAMVTVEGLAQQIGMSVSTLERYVRRHLRLTPRELLQQIRLQRARHLLTHSTMKIGEIALACGYESFSSFSRIFKKRFGLPPGRVRERGTL